MRTARAGKYRHRVTLEWLNPNARSDSGERADAWEPGVTVWAEVRQLRGRLLFAADQANSDTTATIRLRWRPAVAQATGKTLRLRHAGQLYRIDGRPIDVDGRRIELEVMVHEWV
ncbi:phage head closure protein [Zobellella sp. DQSA1]|uniref:phage head closure protein n=1 Tax=Zobellella sp. DQSA1 TaxID=3342386 RepID=UPI0035C1A78A